MAKSKKTNSTIYCPCCNKSIYKAEIQEISTIFPFEGMLISDKTNRTKSFVEIIQRYPSFYQWACDNCMAQKKAILGNPHQQNYQLGNPYLAYFDKTFTCQSCKEDFVFSKEDQQYWYEKLQFLVYSKPNHCKECRKEIREAKNLNTELSNLLKNGKPDEEDSLLRIAAIYKEMGKSEKMKVHLAEVEKLNKK